VKTASECGPLAELDQHSRSALFTLSFFVVREEYKQLNADYEKSEEDLKSLQSVGQSIGEVLRQLDEDKCSP